MLSTVYTNQTYGKSALSSRNWTVLGENIIQINKARWAQVKGEVQAVQEGPVGTEKRKPPIKR